MASPPDVQVSFVDSSSIPGKKRRHAPKSENLKRSSTDPPPKRPRHTALSLSLPVVTGSRAPATQHAFNPHGHLTPATRNGSIPSTPAFGRTLVPRSLPLSANSVDTAPNLHQLLSPVGVPQSHYVPWFPSRSNDSVPQNFEHYGPPVPATPAQSASLSYPSTNVACPLQMNSMYMLPQSVYPYGTVPYAFQSSSLTSNYRFAEPSPLGASHASVSGIPSWPYNDAGLYAPSYYASRPNYESPLSDVASSSPSRSALLSVVDAAVRLLFTTLTHNAQCIEILNLRPTISEVSPMPEAQRMGIPILRAPLITEAPPMPEPQRSETPTLRPIITEAVSMMGVRDLPSRGDSNNTP